MLIFKSGNLLDATETFLCHQTNCITKSAAHLSKDVFDRFQYADIYSGRGKPDVPGTIKIRGNGTDKRYIINMLGQFYPGRPRYPKSTKDGFDIREQFFKLCLIKMAKLSGDFAFPFGIGCGAAGGNWDNYFTYIENFSTLINGVVVIYKLS